MKTAVWERVKQDCLSSDNALGPSFFNEHIVVVADYATRLAAILGGDSEVVELAACLHDISAVHDISTLPNHAVVSAETACAMLGELGYASDRTQRVAQCIRTHSAPIASDCGSIEEVCLSNADAIAQIVRPAFWCHFVYGFRNMSFEDGRQWLRDHLEDNWAGMIMPARKLAREGYEIFLGLLRDFEHPLSVCSSEKASNF